MKEMSDHSGTESESIVQPFSAQSAVALNVDAISSVSVPSQGAQLVPSKLGGLYVSHIWRAAMMPPSSDQIIMIEE